MCITVHPFFLSCLLGGVLFLGGLDRWSQSVNTCIQGLVCECELADHHGAGRSLARIWAMRSPWTVVEPGFREPGKGLRVRMEPDALAKGVQLSLCVFFEGIQLFIRIHLTMLMRMRGARMDGFGSSFGMLGEWIMSKKQLPPLAPFERQPDSESVTSHTSPLQKKTKAEHR